MEEVCSPSATKYCTVRNGWAHLQVSEYRFGGMPRRAKGKSEPQWGEYYTVNPCLPCFMATCFEHIPELSSLSLGTQSILQKMKSICQSSLTSLVRPMPKQQRIKQSRTLRKEKTTCDRFLHHSTITKTIQLHVFAFQTTEDQTL